MSVPKSLPLVALLLFSLTACKQEKSVAVNSPPPKITVARPIVRDVPHWDEFEGRLEAVQIVDLKAQVSGEVESVTFTEGSLVKKGDVLLTIDSRIFRAQLEGAQAALLQDRARLDQSKAVLPLSKNDLQREQEAANRGAATSSELEAQSSKVAENAAAIAENEATIAAAEAAVKIAQLNVEWCTVTAPINGRISSKDVTPGNMINGGAGQATHLTTISSVSPIYCYVDADEASVLKYQRLAREKKRISAADHPIACFMGLDSDTDFPHSGVMDFVDNRIDPTTGTRRARGIFDNPDGTLLPGFRARIRVIGETYPNATLVIDDAVGSDQDRKYLFILHPDTNTVERRLVEVGPLEGELRIILTEVKPEELVVVNGNVRLTALPPTAKVDPTTVPMPEHRMSSRAAAAPPATTTAPATSPASAPATQGGGAGEGAAQ